MGYMRLIAYLVEASPLTLTINFTGWDSNRQPLIYRLFHRLEQV